MFEKFGAELAQLATAALGGLISIMLRKETRGWVDVVWGVAGSAFCGKSVAWLCAGVGVNGLSLNDSRVRTLLGNPSGAVYMSNAYGKSNNYVGSFVVGYSGWNSGVYRANASSGWAYGGIRTTTGGPLPSAVYSSTTNTNRLYVSLSQFISAGTKSVEWPGFYVRHETTGPGVNFIDINEIFQC